MSYDVYMTMDTGGEEMFVWVGNMTSNVAGMWRDAMPGDDGVAGLDGRKGIDCITDLRKGIDEMAEFPAVYKRMNPENGWGSYEGALEYLKEIIAACERYPQAVVRVSR